MFEGAVTAELLSEHLASGSELLADKAELQEPATHRVAWVLVVVHLCAGGASHGFSFMTESQS